MIKKIILKFRLLFAKTHVAIVMRYKDDYSVECHIKKVGDKFYIIKTKYYKNYALNKQQGQYNE